MRLLLLSDIHANQAALEAVLEHAKTLPQGYDQVVSLGDALGYGPNPREVLQTLRELAVQHETRFVLGNHDALALQQSGLTPAGSAAPDGSGLVSQVIAWQLTQLQPDDLKWVATWQDGQDDSKLGLRFRHGTPTSLDTYTDSVTAARDAFQEWLGRVGFVGHTHLPAVYATLNAPVGEWVKHQAFPNGGSYLVPPGARVILNPGSVGQPRDGNPQASYATFDTARNQFKVYRVDYDLARTQEDVRRAGLPEVMGERLSLGK